MLKKIILIIKKYKKLFLFVSIGILSLLILGFFIIHKINLKRNQFLKEIKIYLIHPVSKQLKSTTILTPKDEFLISFKYYNYENKDKLNIFLQKNDNLDKEKIYEGPIEIGDNELCCFNAPSSTGSYKLIFVLNQKTMVLPLLVTNKIVTYDFYYLSPTKVISYPHWQILDTDLINQMINNIYYSYSKKLSERFSVLLAVQDDNNSRFMISQRVINNYKQIPFGNIVQDILKQENEALIKANIITDYKIIDQKYGNKEIYLKVRNIINGISYIIFNKTYETTNLLNQKVLISISLTCPEKLVDFYQPIADYIFSHVNLNGK
ncbi:MAG: hypothetical protein ACP5J8_00445 [Minisyncoccia bacterium]